MNDAASVNLFQRFERRLLADKRRRELPVVLLTGFLGAGKSTLLVHLLKNRSNLRVAAAVNDYSDVNVDGELVGRQAHDGVVTLSSGCFCCDAKEEFERAVHELLSKENDEMVDYLLVECNGVTDPWEAIQTLDKPFGKMTRARLDAVICVVDADAALGVLGHDDEAVASIARSQLRQADVVVLNKVDLAGEDRLTAVRAAIAETAPNATVVPCSFGRVDLTQVLDVRRNEDTTGGTVTHEKAAATYEISSVGRSMRRAAGQDDAGEIAAQNERHGLVTVAFESERPLSLARFQDYLTAGLPDGLLRAKGVLWFAEDRRRRGAFHVSGARRLYVFEDGAWDGQPSASIIMIGRGLDSERVLAELGRMSVDPGAGAAAAAAPASLIDAAAADRALIDASPRFDLFDPAASGPGPAPATGVLHFRLTGRVRYAVDLVHVEHVHGIDLNAVNEAVLQAVNFSGGRAILTSRTLDDGTVVLRWASGGERGLADVWATVEEEGERVLLRDFGKILKCACGR